MIHSLIEVLASNVFALAVVVGKMNEAYQHGFTAASIFQQKQLEDDWRRTINQIHDEVNADTWGIPNQLLGVYREVLADKRKYENINLHDNNYNSPNFHHDYYQQ